MSSSGKGKGKAVVSEKDSAFGGKRKRDKDDDKTGRKGKNRAVLQFFDDEAGDAGGYDSSDDSIFGNGNLDDLFGSDTETKVEPMKAQFVPFLPKEEEMSEEELDKMLAERYKNGSGAVRYAEDSDNTQRSAHIDFTFPSGKDPVIWKLKCAVGRERHSVFCLMQKYVELRALGTKLQIISAISLDHVKGFIFVEAEKQTDVNEACKGLCSIFLSRTSKIAANEMSQLLSTRNKVNVVFDGAWARVKSGTYKGDLAQVVAVNDSRKRATVKLIPRIDLQNLALKFGGGGAPKKNTIPPPRLISLAELEEFRPLIQFRRDRDTDLTFQVIDGLMLKDGYVYKKVPLDSLNFSGVNPSEDEILKFSSSEKDESNDLEWLSQLYGGRDKKRPMKSLKKSDKGGGKGEGSSSSLSLPNGYELHDLVCFGRKDFGIILGFEKDNCKIMKDAPEGPVVVTVDPSQLTTALSDTKFTALDQKKKTLSLGDTVKVVEGPTQGRQGIVKHVYRGVIFLTDDSEDNDGYFSAKSFTCEKVKLADDTFQPEGASGFTDFPSSPKSHMPRERNFGREDKDGMFSVGQTLRIRVGPLKGYLCRVLAIRYSDITVKLNSQTKIYTVKSEHLSEVQKTITASDILDSNPDAVGNLDSCGDWMNGAGTSTENNGWNVGAATERSGWPSFPAADATTLEQSRENNNSSWENHPKNDGWGSGTDATQNSSWGGWDKKKPEDGEASGSGWGQVAAPLKDVAGWENKKTMAQSSELGGWGQKKPENNESGEAEALSSTWGKDAGPSSDTQKDAGGWETKKTTNQSSEYGGWGQKKPENNESGEAEALGSTWGKKAGPSIATQNDAAGWGNKKTTSQSSEWGGWGQKKPENNESGQTEALGSTWGKDAGPSSDTQKDAAGWETKKTTNKSSEWGGWGQKKSENNESGQTEALGSTWGKDARPSSDTQKGAAGWETEKIKNRSSEWGGWGQKKPENNESGEAEALDSTGGKDAGPSSDTQKDAAGWETKKTTNQSSGWGGWGQKKPENKESREAEALGSTWGKDVGPSGDSQKDAVGWGNKKTANQSSEQGGWGKKTDDTGGRDDITVVTERQDSTSAWGKRKNVSENPSSGWGTLKSTVQDASSWGHGGSTEQTDSWKKPNVSSTDEGAAWIKQGADSSWGKQGGESSWHKSAVQQDDLDPKSFDRESGGRWGRGRGRDQRGGRSFGRGSSSEWSRDGDSFSGNSSSWKSDTGGGWGGQSSTFGGRSNTSWNSDRPKDDSLNSESGGRGGFDRGSFRGRGRSERGGFRGRGSFDRGGRRGGFSGRGGFGGGRDRGGDGNGGGWKDRDSSEQKSWNNEQGGGWNNENNTSSKAGWSKEGDSQTGGSSNWKNWGCGGGTDEIGLAGGGQHSGWSQGGSWNATSSGSKGTEGSNSQAGSWGKNDETGGWKAGSTRTSKGGWSREPSNGAAESSTEASAADSQSTGWGSGGMGWNRGTGMKEDGRSNAQMGNESWK